MDKTALIKAIIEREDLPFKKDDQGMLEGLSEVLLSAILEKETEEQKVARLEKEKEDLRKEIEDEVKKEIEASLRESLMKEIRAEMKKDLDAKDQTIVTLQETSEKLANDVKSTSTLLEKETDLRKEKEYTAEALEKEYPGDVGETARTMLLLEKTNPEALTSFRKSMEGAGAALKAAGVLSETGTRLENDGGDTYSKLQECKIQLMKDNPEMKETDAWRKVIKDNPGLYKDYTKARQAEIKANEPK